MSDIESSSTTSGLPIAPALGPALASVHAPIEEPIVNRRLVTITLIAIAIGIVAALASEALTALIALITNIAYRGELSTAHGAPTIDLLGPWSIAVPVVGALIVGVIARFGSPAIRGHGIPEVMEKVLYGESRIPARLMFLKPLSASIAIGTGGPFGAEGPIVATGGALGSVVGQMIRTSSDERKVLLAAGAAAGMAATFGTPVSAVLLAMELLLFEYRPRSIVPVAMASTAATAIRYLLLGSAPAFDVPMLDEPSGAAIAVYALLGVVMGFVAVGVTRAVYGIEDLFERLPIHWMWWPALGAIVVGVVGYIDPRTLGVGYQNIEGIISGKVVGTALVMLVALKFTSWAIYLGSGTSGGTLAPMFTIGGGVGALIGSVVSRAAPSLGVDLRVAALVGMAAIFAGASHAFLASIVFAFEATRESLELLPILAGCGGAYMVSRLTMRSSIMTERLARRGVVVRTDYAIDHLLRTPVSASMAREVVTIAGDEKLADVRARLETLNERWTHQGFPVVDRAGNLIGVVTRRNIYDHRRDPHDTVEQIVSGVPIVVFPDNTLRDAADQMTRHEIGRLPVVERDRPRHIVGIITRSDLLAAHEDRLTATGIQGA
jgi:chloride channel protein, CIC family